MPVLGASTKHYKAYGKRTTNIVNRRTQLASQNEPDWAKDDSDSSSSESHEDDESPAPAGVRTVAKQPLRSDKGNVAVRGRSGGRSSFELVVETTHKATRDRPKKGVAVAGKENAPAARRYAHKPGTESLVSVASDPTNRRQKRVEGGGSTCSPANAKPQNSGVLRPARQSDSSDVAVLPARRKFQRKVLVISSSESEREARHSPSPPTTPSPVVSDLSSITTASSIRASETRSPPRPGLMTDEAPTPKIDEAAAPILAQLDLDNPGHGDDESRGEVSLGRARRPRASAAVTGGKAQGRASSSRRLPSASTHPRPPQLTLLFPSLLSPTIYNFTSFVSSPPPPLANRAVSSWWTKIGEASYSEVFSTAAEAADTQAGTIVVKIIPIADPSNRGVSAVGDKAEEEMPFMSEWAAVHREIETSRLLGGDQTAIDGFVRFKGAFLVQGSYPEDLLISWDDYKAKQSPPSDEQIRPHVFESTQLYALILLEDAGTDLEMYKLRTWREAASVLAQATDTLARAERACEFEHRDLHWGNVLLRPSPTSSDPSVLRRQFSRLGLAGVDTSEITPTWRSLAAEASRLALTPDASGITATVIDFTLSRCRNGDRVIHDPFDDDAIFEGSGDEQFDVYRRMREVVERAGGDWNHAHPRTNILWLHYLAKKLLKSKRLKPPTPSLPAAQFSSPPDSPRAAPSPRKLSFARRYTTGSSSMPFSSPQPVHRRPRTQPASLLPGGRKAVLLERELEAERRAYTWLVSVTNELERVISRDWQLDGTKERSKKAAANKRSKSREVERPIVDSSPQSAHELACLLFDSSR